MLAINHSIDEIDLPELLMCRLAKIEVMPIAIQTDTALDKAMTIKLSSNFRVVRKGECGLVV